MLQKQCSAVVTAQENIFKLTANMPPSQNLSIISNICAMTSIIQNKAPQVEGTPHPIDVVAKVTVFQLCAAWLNPEIDHGCLSEHFGWGDQRPRRFFTGFERDHLTLHCDNRPNRQFNCKKMEFPTLGQGKEEGPAANS